MVHFVPAKFFAKGKLVRWPARNGRGQLRPSRFPTPRCDKLKGNSALRDESRSFQDSGSVDGVSEEEEALLLLLLLNLIIIISNSRSRFDPQRDGRVHVGHRQRDDRRRRDLHLRAVQRLEPLRRRPRREREGRKKERMKERKKLFCRCDEENFVRCGADNNQARDF